jgi:hypothetical protein
MSTLLINGCSFANIWQPTENFIKSLDCDRVVNLGKDGGSFRRAVRTTIEWIAQNGNPNFVIIPIPPATRWELAISKNDDTVDGTWYPMQIKQYLYEEKISQQIDFKKLEKLTELYYGSIPDIRTYWDSCFTDVILLSSFLEQNKIEYLIFDMCNNFEMTHLKGYKGFEKIKLINNNKKIIDLFGFCGNKYMYQNIKDKNKKEIDTLMHHHSNKEYKDLENYLLNYRKLYL